MDRSTKKLLNGSVVYFIGSALSQLASLLLMRFVTGNVTPEEYGFFNLVTTISNLVIPFVTLQVADAVLKFVLKAQGEEDKRAYLTVCFLVSIGSAAVILVGVFVLSCFVAIPHTLLVGLYVASYALNGIYHKVLRCLGRSKVLVSSSLIKTVLFLVLEIVLISALNMGLEALLLAHVVSIAISFVYAEIRVRALKYFDLHAPFRKAFGEMTRFSLPLMPNAAFWWLTSSVNNVIVSARLGVGVNGIYAVSGKFSTVLTMIVNVLNMSWQDTAIAEYGTEAFNAFLTKTFNTFVKLIFSAVAVLVPFMFVILPYMVDPSYYGAIPFAPFLLLAAGLSAMSGFMAQIYVGKGKTNSILVTSLCGMVANVLTILLLIDQIGLWAAVFGSIAADTVLFGVRTFFARKEFAAGIDFPGIAVVALMLGVGIYLYLTYGTLVNLIWLGVTVVLAVILNWQFLRDFFMLLFGRLLKSKTEEATL